MIFVVVYYKDLNSQKAVSKFRRNHAAWQTESSEKNSRHFDISNFLILCLQIFSSKHISREY